MLFSFFFNGGRAADQAPLWRLEALKHLTFPAWFFKHRRQPLNSVMIGLAVRFHLKFVTSPAWEKNVIWMPVLSAPFPPPRNVVSSESCDETDSPVTPLPIKPDLHGNASPLNVISVTQDCVIELIRNYLFHNSLFQCFIFPKKNVLWAETTNRRRCRAVLTQPINHERST